MIFPELWSPCGQTFDPEYLKTIAPDELVGALVYEASATVCLLEGRDQTTIGQTVAATTHETAERDPSVLDISSADQMRGVLNRLSQTLVHIDMGTVLDPESAAKILGEKRAKESIARIGRIKEVVELNLTSQQDDPSFSWNRSSPKNHLMKICDEQSAAGISTEIDFVRLMAVKTLPYPGPRGVVLLRNSEFGDQESYDLGYEAIQEAITANNLDWQEARDALSITSKLLQNNDANYYEGLADLAIDLLARLRTIGGERNIPYYTAQYAMIAANLAVTFRNIHNRNISGEV